MGPEFWATLIGAAVGVVAGAFIQFIVQAFIDRRRAAEQRDGLRKEMFYNVAVMNDLSKEAGRLRNAVNGDALATYFGYFAYERGLFVQTAALLNAGRLYKWFSIDALKSLQQIVAELSAQRANWVNAEITKRRESISAGTYDKVEVVQFVNFIEVRLSEIETLLAQFIKAI